MKITIKRYSTRKLYDTVAKNYITLDGIGDLIRAGNDIVVIDSSSGDDITNFVLTQIIMGQERKGESILSQGLLTGIIRAHHETVEAIKQMLQAPPGLRNILSAHDIPTRDDINKLTEQLDKLAQLINQMTSDGKETGGS